MAKRRRVNGTLEGAASLSNAAPDGANDRLAEGPIPASTPEGLERTDFLVPPETHEAALPAFPAEAPSRHIPADAAPIGNASLAPPTAMPATSLEQRVRRLEDAMAQLQEIRAVEKRTANRLAETSVPVAVAIPKPAPTDALWDFGKRMLSGPVEVAQQTRRAWLLFESLTEARAIFCMFTDPRYRLSWTGRIVPPVLTFLIVISWAWVPFSSIPIFGVLIDRAVILVLAFVLFKLLSHEARRYRETAPDLPPSLRL